MAVGLWGLVLFLIRGPLWIADVLFGLAVLLLLIWQPDVAPIGADAVSAQQTQ
jgi:hypothetical protein